MKTTSACHTRRWSFFREYLLIIPLGFILCFTANAGISTNPLLLPDLSGAGDLLLSGDGSINNNGVIVILGNLSNSGSSSLGTGTIKMTGAASQSISGSNTIQNLEVNNTSGIVLNGPVTVNGTLTLANGTVSTGASDLILGPSATIAGTPGSSRMVVATGSGKMYKQYQGSGTFTFPLGDATGTAEYSPVTLSFTSGTFGTDNSVGVNLANAAYPGSSGSYLNRYWNISSSGITNFSCNARFNYLPADVNGTESSIYCVKVDPLPSVIYDSANVSLHQLSANGLSSFGTFTGKPGDRSLSLGSVFLEGLYSGSGVMSKAQDENGGHFGGDTTDVISIVLHKATNYPSVAYTATVVGLHTNGVAGIMVPGRYNESYYITVRHRNSIATTTATPVLLSESSISYFFDSPAKAYGGNLGVMIDGTPVIYTGDPNQDGLVDASDLSDIENQARLTSTGYIPEDLSGDGLVDASDLSVSGNNARLAIGVIEP
jgi:hypothetical protein